jgi:hypothetical protein
MTRILAYADATERKITLKEGARLAYRVREEGKKPNPGAGPPPDMSRPARPGDGDHRERAAVDRLCGIWKRRAATLEPFRQQMADAMRSPPRRLSDGGRWVTVERDLIPEDFARATRRRSS